MMCHTELNNEFIYLHTPRTTRSKYLHKVAERVVQEETIILTATKEHLATLKRIKLLESRIRHLRTFIRKHPEDNDTIIFINRSFEQLYELRAIADIPPEESIANVTHTIIVCPIVECPGTIIEGACDVCKTRVCQTCRMCASDEHVCDPGVLETLKLLKKDTKPCPQCNVPIHKIDGCDQMFCVSCHIAFSWRTGRREFKIHNPHYYQWLRERGEDVPRNDNDNNDPCNDDTILRAALSNKQFIGAFRAHNHYCERVANTLFLEKVFRELRVVIARISEEVFNVRHMNQEKRDLRIKYILQSQDTTRPSDHHKHKADWITSIQTLLRKHEMHKDCLRLLQTFEQVLRDTVITAYETNNYTVLYTALRSLDIYFREQVREIKLVHGLSPPISISIPEGILSKRWLNR